MRVDELLNKEVAPFVLISDTDPWKSLAELAAPDTLFSRIYDLIIRH